ncbi:MAG: acetoin dehydrogenase dihydrolipoyllysine-residue acetyltransferase subunit [Rhodospirillaceae bacterium]|jgi:pyruvate dehydrogenase E2 component (dihydrolipoamide acetyltransferase)|nr:acetoin dehydrogenase dihydrolipoyllysine-residue acetyltransferase subunit [Rhodospirillaceae bacterium]
MAEDRITAITMPKWGMTDSDGKLVAWLVEEGASVEAMDELVEMETTKITGAIEAPMDGLVRRLVAKPGDVVPIGGLLAVMAASDVPQAEVDAFVEAFEAPESQSGEGDGAGDMRMVEAAGRNLRVRSMGEGEATPVVLIHGFGGDLDAWLFNQEALAADRPVHAIELPGHGQSSKDVGDGGPETLGGAVSAALDALEVDRAFLIGQSMGGALALDLALSRPGLAAGLVLIAGAALGEEIAGEFLEAFGGASRRKEMKAALQALFADPELVNRNVVEGALRNRRLEGAAEALAAVRAAWFAGGRQAHILAGRMGEIDAPILALWGAEDRIIPAAHAKAVEGHGEISLIEGIGHMAQMEAAGEVNRRIRTFIADHES